LPHMHTFSCQQIAKTYYSNNLTRKQTVALRAVSFHVEHHEIFGIIGLNGAGKSTILKILMGFVRPGSGVATIAGISAAAPYSHAKLGYLPEHPSLYPHLSVTEHLQFGCRIAGLTGRESEKKIRSALEMVDLHKTASIPVKEFSKGMTQRAALAYAILLTPEFLILDEPMSGLDPLGRQLVLDIITESQSLGATILFCSHILTDVERVCGRIGIMNRGQMLSVTDTKSFNTGHAVTANSKTPLESFFLDSISSPDEP